MTFFVWVCEQYDLHRELVDNIKICLNCGDNHPYNVLYSSMFGVIYDAHVYDIAYYYNPSIMYPQPITCGVRLVDEYNYEVFNYIEQIEPELNINMDYKKLMIEIEQLRSENL